MFATHDTRGRARGRSVLAGALAVAVALAVYGGIAGLAGCARRSPAQAGLQEERLTHDQAVEFRVRVSPDGKRIAYAAATRGGEGPLAVFVIPGAGGDPRRISPDSVSMVPVGWTSDGRIHCASPDARTLYSLGLDGSVRTVRKAEALTRFADVSPDGETELLLWFNRDNHDLALRRKGGELELLAATTQWEEEGLLGPGPDQVTVVSAPSYQSNQTTISLWSRATGTFAPLPLPEGRKWGVAWSPDQRHMAYTSLRGGQSDVWIYDAEAARARPLVEDSEDSGAPAWYPDGQWLVFSRSTRTSHLFAGLRDDPNRRQITEGPARDGAPMVSPDGKWIVFTRRPAPGAGVGDEPILCVVGIGGGPVTELDLGSLRLPDKGGACSWSRDSRQIAFSALEGTSKLDIYRIGRDGLGLARVTVGPGDEVEPMWAPDGRSISFTQVGGGRTQVVVVPSNGGVPRVMSEEGLISEGGAWRPDSREFAYCVIREQGVHEIWLVAPRNPAGRKRLLRSETMAWPLLWSRDGQRLLLVRGKYPEWYFTAFTPGTGVEVEVGREVMLPGGSSYAKLNERGEEFRDLLLPGGVVVADGEQSGDLYRVRVGALLKTRLASVEDPRVSWITSIAWAESY